MTALILVDIQNDFLPGGSLAVRDGNGVIKEANKLMPQFDRVIATQDWHPQQHISFAESHCGKDIYDTIPLSSGITQTLWPSHCVQKSFGAEFPIDLDIQPIHRVFQKGTRLEVDSYSGFYDNDRQHSTGLAEWLTATRVDTLTILGLATDYCVKYTVLDALSHGFQVTLHLPGCRGVENHLGDTNRAIQTMADRGAAIHS